MEKRNKTLRRKAYYSRKSKKAAHLLFYKHHQKAGVKGWELRKKLGSDYPKVLKILNNYLQKLDLHVKTVFEDGELNENPTLKQLDKARFYITLKSGVTTKEDKLMGWRIDDIAGLAVAISYVLCKKGKAPRNEVEELLRDKLPRWRVDINLDKYIRSGYLGEDEDGQLYLEWRTKAEIDQKKLIELLLTEDSKIPGKQ